MLLLVLLASRTANLSNNSLAEVAGTMPLDVAKTQMQMHPGKYTGPINCLSTIYRTTGIRGWWMGATSFGLQTAGKASIRFTAFAKIKDSLEFISGPGYTNSINMSSGLLAGFVEAAVWTTPTERIKVLRQTEVGGGNKYGNLFLASRYIVQTQGISGLFVGLVPTSIRQASSVGVRFALYPSVKEMLNFLGLDQKSPSTHMIAGGTVGGLSVILNNPVDVIKSLQQSNKLNAQGKPMGTIECGQFVMRESGPAGFMRGLTARVPRVFCGQAITFAVYERVAAFLAGI
jgi:solute carrier family 25 citrate transporter 1